MSRNFVVLLCCLLLLSCVAAPLVQPAYAGEKEERIKLLQEKLKKLKDLLSVMQEQKLKETPPTEIPWDPVVDFGLERPAYDQYAYLLAPQMQKEQLDSVLQQLYFFAGQDELKERGTLFVIPALPLDEGEVLSVAKYNRELAMNFLRKLNVPTALDGVLVVAPDSLDQRATLEGPLLIIDLAGIDRILRSRIIEQLQGTRLFTEDGNMQTYLWELLKNASPQAFTVFAEGEQLWLSVADN